VTHHRGVERDLPELAAGVGVRQEQHVDIGLQEDADR